MSDADADTRLYYVVKNHELQYSIWLADRDIPTGWTAVGEPADRETCLGRIEELWTDMRPLSARRDDSGQGE